MNFSKKETIRRQKQIKSTAVKMKTKFKVSFFRTFLVGIVAVIIVGVFAGIGTLKGIIDDAPDISTINVVPTGFSTTMYDTDGNEIETLVGFGANRKYKTLDEIPKHVQDAFVAIEDERFWNHNGIDVKGVLRALFTGLVKREFDQGASTITQQLLKNQVFNGGAEEEFVDKLERKIQEQYLAIQVENQYTKEEILEYYLNAINLGQNTLGIQAASLRYFNKDVSKLTISEAAVIAGITQSPTYRNPITYPESNAKRRTDILDNMKEMNYISQEEYDTAMADDVYSRIQIVNEETGDSKAYSYFVDATINQVIEDLQEKCGYSQQQAIDAIYRGGLSIYTTQDMKLQSICDEVLSDSSNYPENSKWELTYRLSIQRKDGEEINLSEGSLKNYFLKENPNFSLLFSEKKKAQEYIDRYKESISQEGDVILGETVTFTIQPQISFTLIEQETGQVKAIVGGRGEKVGNRTLNRAETAKRQPGSVFKVLSSYLPAIDAGGMTLASVQDDAPYSYSNGRPVKDWRKTYSGLTTFREAIWDSNNIVTVKTLAQITPQFGFSYLKNLGFTTLVESRTEEDGNTYSDIQLPMALGGLTDGVTNLELTAAFASISNNGIYIEPKFYTKIVDHDGKVLLENKPERRQVIKESTAWLLTSAMLDVVSQKGTGRIVRLQNVNMPVAGKTGTTTGNKDYWFSGYTPYYTASIWMGYDNNEKQGSYSYHKVMWRKIMEKIHEDLDIKTFTMPDSITTANICNKCGKLAVDGVCNLAIGGSTVVKEYFAKGTVPLEKCSCHVKYNICKASNKLANDNCPENEIEHKVYLIKEESPGVVTRDTANILPKYLENSVCIVHSGAYQNPVTNNPDSTLDPQETIEPTHFPTESNVNQ